MIEKILQKIIQIIFLPKVRKVEKKIGFRLIFRDIPECYINGCMRWDMTKIWKKFGLDVEAGANYWTIGNIVNGISSRFDRNASEYQSWLGGYTVKFSSGQEWTLEDHFKLAIADQNSWLGTHGDPEPMTITEGWKFTPVDRISLDQYVGTLYEGGCTTHSDVGNNYNKPWLYLESLSIAALINFFNPSLRLKSKMMRPKEINNNPYEALKLRGYVAIFDVGENVKVVLYANGTIIPKENGEIDTFLSLKSDLLKAIQSCDIISMSNE